MCTIPQRILPRFRRLVDVKLQLLQHVVVLLLIITITRHIFLDNFYLLRSRRFGCNVLSFVGAIVYADKVDILLRVFHGGVEVEEAARKRSSTEPII